MQTKILLIVLVLVLAVLCLLVVRVFGAEIDNDALLGFVWTAPSNAWSVDYYDVEYWASGFGPQGGTLTSDTTFVVIDVMSWLPGINQMDSVKVRGVNSWGDVGPWSDAAEPVQIHIIPEVPGRPYWTENNQ